jgi:hypothetical protein
MTSSGVSQHSPPDPPRTTRYPWLVLALLVAALAPAGTAGRTSIVNALIGAHFVLPWTARINEIPAALIATTANRLLETARWAAHHAIPDLTPHPVAGLTAAPAGSFRPGPAAPYRTNGPSRRPPNPAQANESTPTTSPNTPTDKNRESKINKTAGPEDHRPPTPRHATSHFFRSK